MMVHTWTRVNELSKYRNALSSGYSLTIFDRETTPSTRAPFAPWISLMAESAKFPSPENRPPFRACGKRGVASSISVRNLSGKYYRKSDSPFARGSPANRTATSAVHGVAHHPFRHATPCILKHKRSRFHTCIVFVFVFVDRHINIDGTGCDAMPWNAAHTRARDIRETEITMERAELSGRKRPLPSYGAERLLINCLRW